MSSLRLFVFFLVFFQNSDSARILGIFTVPSISHQVTFQPIWRELSLRGHNVTVLTPNPLKDPTLTNLTEIDCSLTYKIITEANMAVNVSKDNFLFNNVMFSFNHLHQQFIEANLNHDDVQKMIKNENEYFDVILMETYYPLTYSFGARFKAPIIVIMSMNSYLHTYDTVGNPTHPVISPDVFMTFETNLTFKDRLNSFLFNIWYRMLYYWYVLPRADKIARTYFGNDMPYLGDIEKNTSLVMTNVNPIMHTARANVPAAIEFSGLHIKEKQALPKDLQNYLDSSTRGVVYVSFGSNVKSANMETEVRDTIIAALSELPYDVIWKWETDYLPGKPKNVLIKKWCPQQDILGHPNVKAFVTQGGVQSVEEAIMNEVPMVGVPFMYDQFVNVKKLVDFGMALRIDSSNIHKDELKNAIIQVVTNKSYRDKVREAKNVLSDQPTKGIDKVIWWIEYVIRHKGTTHIRSPAADMSFCEYFMVDVIGFLFGCIYLFLYAAKRIYGTLKHVNTKLKQN